ATSLPDPDAEELRRVLYGPDSPCFVPDEHIVNNEWFFPTSVGEELWKLQGEVDRWLVQSPAAPAHATILVDRAVPSTPRVFKRGNPLTKGESVPRRFLQVMAGDEPRGFERGSGRLELADAIASKDNPLTARIMVNRIWMQHFGRGLVATTSDFGKRAETPSHPELLDWLARRFMDEGWSLKKMHRRILLSAAYQQSSSGPSGSSALRKAQEKDPDNRLIWRMNTHRLGFEEMRDAWLSAAGELDTGMGGRPMDIFAANNSRRTLYALVDREKLPSVFSTFDFANPDLSIPQRTDTVVPQQALFGLNHPFLADRARALAGRVAGAGEADDAGRVRRLFSFLYQRAPTKSELSTALAFVKVGSEPAVVETSRELSLAWQYGYGEMDESTGRLKSFTALPHFNGSAWQGGEKWPDAKLGWAQVTATGGHPGNDRKHAAVRRWVAPQSGNYTITSTLIHEPAPGDGIRAFISHNGRGLLKSATVHQSTELMNLESVALDKGDTLDFVVDIRDVLHSDQFLWSPKVAAVANATSAKIAAWDANRDFTGNPKRLLDAWQQLAQALMLSNEFLFLD
ncbi:MAG TPA: DUF1553 domain-containing protein, partial [Roseimicrobium sp.]|nr:DUF1553 domain-containing protein [Roseimicrobium sp.]